MVLELLFLLLAPFIYIFEGNSYVISEPLFSKTTRIECVHHFLFPLTHFMSRHGGKLNYVFSNYMIESGISSQDFAIGEIYKHFFRIFLRGR